MTATFLSSQSPSTLASPQIASSQTASNHIGLNQTVTGTLYGAEAGTWIFSEGPATVTIILDVGPFGGALIILKDPSEVERAYMDQQKSPGVTQLVNFFIPTDGDYTILVRNAANQQADYTLTVRMPSHLHRPKLIVVQKPFDSPCWAVSVSLNAIISAQRGALAP